MEYYAVTTYDGLYHHGIKGQRWGVRRFQNEDGSVTAAGAKRYYTNGTPSQQKVGQSRMAMDKAKEAYKSANKQYNQSFKEYYKKSGQYYSLNKDKRKANMERFNKAMADGQKVNQAKADYKAAKKVYRVEKKAYKAEEKATKNNIGKESVKGLSVNKKKALKVGAAVAGTALAVYGAKKFKDYVENENTKIVHNRLLRELGQAEHSFEKDFFNGHDRDKFGVLTDRAMNRESKITDAITKAANRAYDAPFKEKVKRVYGGRDWVRY